MRGQRRAAAGGSVEAVPAEGRGLTGPSRAHGRRQLSAICARRSQCPGGRFRRLGERPSTRILISQDEFKDAGQESRVLRGAPQRYPGPMPVSARNRPNRSGSCAMKLRA